MKKDYSKNNPIILPKGINSVGRLEYQGNLKTPWTQQVMIVTPKGGTKTISIPFHSIKLTGQ